MVMIVRHGIVMVVAAHAVLDPKLAVFAAVARHARLGCAAFQVIHPFFQQLKNLALKTEVGGRDKPDGGVLGFQVFYLPSDALDQCSVKQVVRQHHHLRHAQQALPLHGFFKARVSDTGKSQVHQFVVGFFH